MLGFLCARPTALTNPSLFYHHALRRHHLHFVRLNHRSSSSPLSLPSPSTPSICNPILPPLCGFFGPPRPGGVVGLTDETSCLAIADTSEAGTSHGTPAGSAYDVFVSFRGSDTRYDITDVLYVFMKDKGICVFRDTEEVRLAEEIGDELRRAVPDSRIYVVVFSRGYASSAWCLRELAWMVDCRRVPASRKVVLPIFYDVSPDDVKLKTNLYRDALEKHREKYEEEDVKMWEEALKKVGRIRGVEYKRDIGKGEFVSAVVADILNKLKIKDRILPDHLVGMDDHVEKVMGLLNLSSNVERQVVMVYGMGGTGKTTLVKAIFNTISSRFDGCCFLADVRESLSTGVGGVERLQTKLLKDMFGESEGNIRDCSDGMNQIQSRLRNRKVLIIFDNVSERSQLKKLVRNFDIFGQGTIIILTTRDMSVCEGLMRSSDIAYGMEGMSDDHALQLFNRHAFGGEGPPDDFVDLSKRVIRKTGNLPLALEVIGGHLFLKEKNKWEDTLEKLERVPHKDVLNKLRISYDDLEESEKQIFLDIACFDHFAMPKKYASYMWEACGFFPKSGLDVLQNRSLIKVLNVNIEDYFEEKYWMHDSIREMGREIDKSSRLWDPELALNVVRQKQGTDQVLAINLQPDYTSLFNRKKLLLLTGKEFKGMSNLRFLNLKDGVRLSGKFRNFWTNLLWLSWVVLWKRVPTPNPDFFKMDNLIILEISNIEITDDSMKDMRMGNLRVLDFSHVDITRLPDLSRFAKLEIIEFQYCSSLEEIHSSIGVLGNLKCLNIRDCSRLTRLPEELGSAKALQELNLRSCAGISELPESIGGLGDLRILRVVGTKIRKLPSSIGNLKSLEVLEIDGFPWLLRIPVSEVPKLAKSNISGLTSLRSLTLTGLDEYVKGIEMLSGLQKLKLEDVGGKLCGILTTKLGSMSRLEELSLRLWDISSTLKLPSSLRMLELVGCRLYADDNLGNMSHPVRLSDFGSLRRLRSLVLSSYERIDFSGVERMELLEELTVIRCGDLVGEIPNLSKLTRLKRVEFRSYNSLVSVPHMPRDCNLEIYDCRELESFSGPYREYHNN